VSYLTVQTDNRLTLCPGGFMQDQMSCFLPAFFADLYLFITWI